MTRILARLRRWLAGLSPRAIVAFGWLGLVLYGFPGYMSYDSVAQLVQARQGPLLDNHPPLMAWVWRRLELVVTGPALMLLLQTACMAIGLYLVLRARLKPRTAAIAALCVLWCPPVANTMSVIWKDSQMAAYLMLGTGLLFSPRLRVRFGGLALVAVATAMRWNALAMTLPIVGLLFYWRAGQRWWQRYAIAAAAWLALTFAASTVTNVLAEQHVYMWHQSLALLDITGTLRYSEDLTDDEIRTELAGTPIAAPDHLQDHARAHPVPDASPTDDLWNATNAFFARPAAPTPAQRTAIAAAWKRVVTGHLAAYARYRWVVFSQLVQLDGTPPGSPIYCWFTDVQDWDGSGAQISHYAAPSQLQGLLQQAMLWLGTTWLFDIGVFFILALVLVPLCWGDRQSLALVASGLLGEAALFVIGPTVDWRYSFWLVLATLVAAICIVARWAPRIARLRSRGSSRT